MRRSNKLSDLSPEQPTDSLAGSGPRESTSTSAGNTGGRIPDHCSSTNKCEQGGGKVEKKSIIVPSASSIVLDFLEQSAKQKIHESQMTSTPAPAAHTSATAAAAIVNADMKTNNHTPATEAANAAEAADGNNAQSSAVPAPPPQQGHQSVVPQLMDIYDDLTQSSTPQTVPQHQYPAIAAPAPMTSLPTVPGIPQGVYYSGSASSQASVNRSTLHRPVSRGQYGSGGVVYSSTTSAPAPIASSVAAAATARSKSRYTKKTKAEQHEPGQQQVSRKKGKTTSSDQRWSKRFTWPDALHRDFVSAIFDVGLKNCSPSSILEYMPSNPDITSERVKSHLQKYRQNRQKSRVEFMSSYDSAMEKFRKRNQQGEDGEHQEVSAQGSHNLSCGEAAAFCTNETLIDKGQNIGTSSSLEGSQRSVPGGPISSSRSVSSEGEGVGTLQMPLLTADERDSPIGQAFGHLAGMLQALSQQLEGNRRKQGAGRNTVPSSSQVVSSSQSQVAAIHHRHSPHPQQPTKKPYTLDIPPSSLGPPTVEQAAVAAASLHATDPSLHEVAAVVPHAFMVQGRPAVQSSSACGYSPASQPQQHQAQPPQHPQYPQVGQAHAPPTTIQHPSSHYTGVAHAPVSQGEYTQAIHHPQPTQHVPAPHPAYARQHMPAPAPVSHAVPPAHHHHQVQPPAQKHAPSSHQHPQDEIPTISYTIYQPQPQVHAPIHPPPPMASHHPGSALGPPQQVPAPARHHSSAPQPTPVIQTYANQAAPDQQHHHHPTVPSATASHHAPAPTRAPIADSSHESNVNHSLPGTGRTLQAQKESSMMKQEMRGQMLFQNKMRALKQIELSKYGGKGESFSSDLHTQQHEHQHDIAYPADTNVESVVAGASSDGVTANHSHDNNEHTASEQHPQATTEQAQHYNHVSEDLDQDLMWNPEDDDQIFDFLMEH